MKANFENSEAYFILSKV
jgi:hypothetical protein